MEPAACHVGLRVRLQTPDNPRLHGASAVVHLLTAYGAHVVTSAAATGRFRALWCEMEPERPAVPGLNGNGAGRCCDVCGSLRLLQTGSCWTCQDCGTSGGCG
jgi:hypothetical protein